MMLSCLLLDKAKETGHAINSRTIKTGDTVVHIAVDRSRTGTYLVDLVLRYSPDANIKNNEGKTPLDLAKQIGVAAVISRLEVSRFDLPFYLSKFCSLYTY